MWDAQPLSAQPMQTRPHAPAEPDPRWLDALEVQLFGLAIPALIAAFALSKGDAGLVSGVTLITSALGGWLGGTLSDHLRFFLFTKRDGFIFQNFRRFCHLFV